MNTPDITITTLHDGTPELGEGVTHDPETGTLYWFDILGRTLYARADTNGRTTAHALPFMASALGVIDDRRQMIIAEDGLYIRDRSNGALGLFSGVETNRPGNRSNDARVHPSGALWFSTMSKTKDAHAGRIYCLSAGAVHMIYSSVTIPNAICFSPSGDRAYFTDTVEAMLMTVAIDPRTGLPIGAPAVLIDHRGKVGGLDGAICDATGRIWNARWGASALDCHGADGAHHFTVTLPMRQPSCPAFMGRNRIAVTSAWEGMSDDARRADPKAGNTIAVDFPVDFDLGARVEPRVRID